MSDIERDPLHGFNLGNEDPKELHRILDEAEREEERELESDKRANVHSFSDGGDKKKQQRVKTVNNITMPWDAYWWYNDHANDKNGMRIDKYIVSCLIDYMENWHEVDDSDSIERQVLWHHSRSQVISRLYDRAYEIAVNYADHPTEEHFAILVTTCKKIGLDPSDLLRQIQKEPLSRAVASMKNDSETLVSRCMRWLSKLFVEADMIPSSTVLKLARDAGWADHMVRRARIKLGIDSSPINGEPYMIVPKQARIYVSAFSQEVDITD